MVDRVAYFEMTFEFLETALQEAFNMPSDVHILDVAIEHDILYQPTKRTLRIKVESPDFLSVGEGEQIPRKDVMCQMKRWEFR